MMRSAPCPSGTVGAQTRTLNPEGVAEMEKKKDSKRENEKRKGLSILLWMLVEEKKKVMMHLFFKIKLLV